MIGIISTARLLTGLCLLAAHVSGAEASLSDVTAGSGANIHFTDARPGELEMMKEAGFKWVRMDLGWQGTEREKGVYDFSAHDRLLASLEKAGIRAYFILDYSNSLYEPQGSVRSEEGRRAYTRWALAALGHFKGRGVCWEIWNEPNGAGFWPPRENVSEFVAMALMASKAIHEAYPGERLVGPATSTIDLPFLEACFRAGLLQYWSGVSVHPYRQSGPESVEADYHALRTLIAEYAPEGKRIEVISGEWGYSSAWDHFNPEAQGRMLPREWLVNAACGIPLSIWYDWHDDGTDPKEGEHHFGTVENAYHQGRTPVYDPKPAYLAAKHYNAVLKGCRFVKRLSLGRADQQALLFQAADGRQVLAAWTSSGIDEVSVKLPATDGAFPTTGSQGESLPETMAKNGMLDLKLSGAVRYVVFPKGNAKLAAAQEALPVRLAILPPAGNKVLVRFENQSGRAFKATLKLTGAGTQATDISLEDEAVANTVSFQLKEPPASGDRLGARLEVNGVVVAEAVPRTFVMPDSAWLDDLRAAGDGDPKVGGTFTLARSDAPQAAPATAPGGVMRLDYAFQDGWKFAVVQPGQAAREISGSPAKAAFGMWIYGNGSHLSPRLRLTDAGGRTWQPSAPEIGWTGWKYVEWTLDADTGHWGGADPDLHRAPLFPLKWDALLLLDNPKRAAAQGSIYFTLPCVMME